MSEDDLMELASLYIPTFDYIDNDIILFTELQITQPGNLVKWTFAADLLYGVQHPTLVIYRENNGRLERLVDLAISHQPLPTNYSNVYESIIKLHAPVQAGDVVGLELPENARLMLVFLLNYGSVGGKSLQDNGLVDGLPLVSLDIGMYTIL